jgi:putative transposase
MGRKPEENAQRELRFRSWGGRRTGAGRPKSKRSGVPHQRQPSLASRHPVHVTLNVHSELSTLRCKKSFRAIRQAFLAGHAKEGFRLCHFSVQDHHIHVLVEAKNRECLTRGVAALKIRMARALNRLHQRRGSVFADRYHAHVLKTPREVRAALCYVLNNRLRHRPVRDGDWFLMDEDYYSSAAWFDGWRTRAASRTPCKRPPLVVPAKTWLLSAGWRRHGLLVPAYLPPKSHGARTGAY